MKEIILDFLRKIFEFILKNKDKNEIPEKEPTKEEIKQNEEEVKQEEPKEEPKQNEEEIKQDKPKEEPKEEPKVEEPQPPKVEEIKETKTLTLKEQQTYLKKLGLYTKKIDGIRGAGHKKAVKQFNTIFLNKESEVYYNDTDKLLREIYDSYNKSPYMVDSDWKYFKNFKSSEFYCTCRKKYCDGWNGLRNKIPMHLLMADQYIRNHFGKAVSLTSTIRCDKRNKEVGGVKNSKHRLFRANDMGVKGIKAANVKKFVYTNSSTKLPFINYAYDINANYEHIDVII